jgi:conjugative relaxase-like TrwC/TraI family protein
MLSISSNAITDAGKATGYFLKQDGYFFRECSWSRWVGNGASYLGIEGKSVDEKTLHLLLEGKDPKTAEMLCKKVKNRRCGYDACFSLPKSLSILMLLSDKKTRETLEHIIREGLPKYLISKIENDCAQIRQYNNGERPIEQSKNLTCAVIEHNTTQCGDPQKHYHLLFMNLSKDSKGKWKALASEKKQSEDGPKVGSYERLMENRVYYGMVGQDWIAKQMIKLGFDIEVVGKQGWELKQVPKILRDEFSTMRKLLEAELQKLPEHERTPERANIINRNNRNRIKKKPLKGEHGLEKQRAGWISKALEVFKREQNIQTPTPLIPTLDSVAKEGAEKQQEKIRPIDQLLIKQALHQSVLELGKYRTVLAFEEIMISAMRLMLKKTGQPMHDELFDTFKTSKDSMGLIPLDKDGKSYALKSKIGQAQRLIGATEQACADSNQLKLKKNARIDAPLKNDRSLQHYHYRKESAAIDCLTRWVGQMSKHRKSIRILVPASEQRESLVEDIIDTQPLSFFEKLFPIQNAHEKVQSVKSYLVNPKKSDLVVVHRAHQLPIDELQSMIELAKKNKTILLSPQKAQQSYTAGNPLKNLKKGGVQSKALPKDETHPSKSIDTVGIVDQTTRDKSFIERLANQPSAQGVVGCKQAIQNLTPKLRKAYQHDGVLAKEELTIPILKPIYLDDAKRKVARNYRKGQIVRIRSQYGQRKWHIYTIKDIVGNKLLFHESKKPFALNTTQYFNVFSRESLAIAEGEQLMALSHAPDLNIRSGQRICVKKLDIKGKQAILQVGHKKTMRVRLDKLNDLPVQYNYLKTPLQLDHRKQKTIVAHMQSYQLKKPVVLGLMDKLSNNGSLQVITDNAEKAQKKFHHDQESKTIIDTVVDAANQSQQKTDWQSTFFESMGHQPVKLEEKEKPIDSVMIAAELLIKNANRSFTEKAVDHAITVLSDQSTGIQVKDIVEKALKFAKTSEEKMAISEESIQATIDAKKVNGDLYHVPNSSPATDTDLPDDLYVTREALEREVGVIQAIVGGMNKFEPLCPNLTFDEQSTLTAEQQNALKIVLGARDQFSILQGNPGTGKTTVFKSVRELLAPLKNILKDNNVDVKIVAPTNKAVKEIMAKDPGFKSQTLRSFLNEPLNLECQQKTLYILDEASMVSNKEFKEFTDKIKALNARVLFAGDQCQHSSPEFGNCFSLSQQIPNVTCAQMVQSMRPKTVMTEELFAHVAARQYRIATGLLENSPSDQIVREICTAAQSSHAKQIDDSKSLIDTKVHWRENQHTIRYSILAQSPQLSSFILPLYYAHCETPKQLSYRLAAMDYVTRTSDEKEKTLVMAPTHNSGGVIAKRIREFHQEAGLLNKEEYLVTTLAPKGLTSFEIKDIDAYEVGNVIKVDGDFWTIDTIKHENHTLFVKNETGESRYVYPNRTNKVMELFEAKVMPLSVGDTIRLSKSNPDLNRIAHERYTIEHIDETKMTVRSKTNAKDVRMLNNTKRQDQLVDQGYTYTSHGVEGATEKHAIIAHAPGYKGLTNQKGFIVDTTRATDTNRMYVPNKEKYLDEVVNNTGWNKSALERLGYIENPNKTPDQITYPDHFKNGIEKQLDPFHKETFQFLFGVKLKDKPLQIEQEGRIIGYNPTTNQLYTLNPKNGKKSQLRFVDIVEERFNAFNIKKDPITLQQLKTFVEKEMVISFQQECIQQAKLDAIAAPCETSRKAKNIAESSLQINKTVAEKYLKTHRGIQKFIQSNDIRFHPKLYSSEDKTYHPALVSVGCNAEGKVQCIEAIYLDQSNHNKAKHLDIQKRGFGSRRGAPIEIHAGDKYVKSEISFITEGVETGLSIKEGLYNPHVLATLSKQNFKTLPIERLGNHVVFCLDNDGRVTPQDKKLLQESMSRLQKCGKTVSTITPPLLDGYKKTDFNDVLKVKGITAIETILKDSVVSGRKFNYL